MRTIIRTVIRTIFRILISENFCKFAMVFCVVASIYYLLAALNLSDGVFQRVWYQADIWRRVTLSISFIIGVYIFWGWRAIVRYRTAVKEAPLRSELNQIKEELAAIKETV